MNIKYFLVSISLFLIFYILLQLLGNEHSNKYIAGNHKVLQNLKSGLIIEDDKSRIYIRTKVAAYPGDIISLTGNVTSIDGEIKNYFQSINVNHSILFPQKIKIISRSTDFRNELYRFIDKQNPLYANYTNLLLLGRKTLANSMLYAKIIKINIVHLFVISGFHFGLIYLILNKILKLFFNAKVASIATLALLIFYGYILRFSIPTQRSLILIIGLTVCRLFKLNFSKIKILNLAMVIMLLLNINIIFSHSFYLTFSATYILLFINKLNFKRQYLKVVLSASIIYFTFIPYTIFLNNYISIFGIIFGYLFTPIIPVIYLIILCIWWMPTACYYFIFIFNTLVLFVHEAAITIHISSFDKNICKITYVVFIYLFIIYTWLDYFAAKKHT